MKPRVSLVIMLSLAMFVLPATAGDNTVKVVGNESHVKHLTDGEGVTLYWFKRDKPGTSSCSGGCVANWPVFYREKVAVTGGLKAEDFGTILRSDGKKQTTFRRYPLYYFVGDAGPGDTNGQGVNGVWFTVDPDNFPMD